MVSPIISWFPGKSWEILNQFPISRGNKSPENTATLILTDNFLIQLRLHISQLSAECERVDQSNTWCIQKVLIFGKYFDNKSIYTSNCLIKCSQYSPSKSTQISSCQHT